MQKLGTILQKVSLDNSDKYLSREFQKYGIYLAEKLEDLSHKGIYIKFAKIIPREILDQALSFVLDANADSKAKLFMWKVKKLREMGNKK